MATRKEDVIFRLSTIMEEAKLAGISEKQLKKSLNSAAEVDDPFKKGCQILDCVVFQIYPLLFLLSLFGYPLFKLFQRSPCLITEVTPLGEAMIPVMNCR